MMTVISKITARTSLSMYGFLILGVIPTKSQLMYSGLRCWMAKLILMPPTMLRISPCYHSGWSKKIARSQLNVWLAFLKFMLFFVILGLGPFLCLIPMVLLFWASSLADFTIFKKVFQHIFKCAKTRWSYGNIPLTKVGIGCDVENESLLQFRRFVGNRPVFSAQALSHLFQPGLWISEMRDKLPNDSTSSMWSNKCPASHAGLALVQLWRVKRKPAKTGRKSCRLDAQRKTQHANRVPLIK